MVATLQPAVCLQKREESPEDEGSTTTQSTADHFPDVIRENEPETKQSAR